MVDNVHTYATTFTATLRRWMMEFHNLFLTWSSFVLPMKTRLSPSSHVALCRKRYFDTAAMLHSQLFFTFIVVLYSPLIQPLNQVLELLLLPSEWDVNPFARIPLYCRPWKARNKSQLASGRKYHKNEQQWALRVLKWQERVEGKKAENIYIFPF